VKQINSIQLIAYGFLSLYLGPSEVTNIHRFSDSSRHCASPPPDMGQTPWYNVVQTKIAAKRGASKKKNVKIGLNPSRTSQCIDGKCPVFQIKPKQYDGRVQNLWITQNLDLQILRSTSISWEKSDRIWPHLSVSKLWNKHTYPLRWI